MHWGRYKVSESSPQFSVYSGPPWSVGHRRKPLRPGRDPAAALLCLGSRPCGKRPQLGLPRTGATWRWGGCSAVRLFCWWNMSAKCVPRGATWCTCSDLLEKAPARWPVREPARASFHVIRSAAQMTWRDWMWLASKASKPPGTPGEWDEW